MNTVFNSLRKISGQKRDTDLSSGHSLWNFRLIIRADGSLVWETAKVNCLAKYVAISTLRVRDLEEKCDGLIGRAFDTFPIKGILLRSIGVKSYICMSMIEVWDREVGVHCPIWMKFRI